MKDAHGERCHNPRFIASEEPPRQQLASVAIHNHRRHSLHTRMDTVWIHEDRNVFCIELPILYPLSLSRVNINEINLASEGFAAANYAYSL